MRQQRKYRVSVTIRAMVALRAASPEEARETIMEWPLEDVLDNAVDLPAVGIASVHHDETPNDAGEMVRVTVEMTEAQATVFALACAASRTTPSQAAGEALSAWVRAMSDFLPGK